MNTKPTITNIDNADCPASPVTPPPVLEFRHLGIAFQQDDVILDAVTDVSFSLSAGEIFCLVGESGCGKSLTAKAVMGLMPENARLSGQIFLEGQEITALSTSALRRLRGHRMGMIFQEPMTALNPVLRVGEQVTEALQLHLGISGKAAVERCSELFHQVGIPAPESRCDDYPHQLSGGMRQRVMTAMALACEPVLLLADEPTTALDVTIQWQILRLLQSLAEDRGMGVLLITHDLGVVAQVARHVGVMYAGQLVECGSVRDVLGNAAHPYTKGLLHSAPEKHSREVARLPVIAGMVPPPGQWPSGCRFHPRCPFAMPRCSEEIPPFKQEAGRQYRCWL